MLNMKIHIETHIHGIKARGKNEFLKHLKGERLTCKQAILANCYDCMGGYTDGKYSCGVSSCPLYLFMPYREVEK